MKLSIVVLSISFWLGSSVCHADTIATINLTTAGLIGHPAGPFSVEFQFTDGSGIGDGNNTVAITNFTFGAGSAIGTATTIGGASGTLFTGVNIRDNSFFNQFIQKFNPGTTLGFQLDLTTNIDSSGTPDEFSFAILDSSGAEIPTQAGPGVDVFAVVDINSSAPGIVNYASDTTRTPVAGGGPINMPAPTLVSGVPEPSTWIMLLTALAVMAAIRHRRSSGPEPFPRRWS
jgi:hypothetical protein